MFDIIVILDLENLNVENFAGFDKSAHDIRCEDTAGHIDDGHCRTAAST